MRCIPDERPATQTDVAELQGEMAALRAEIREDLRHMQGLLAAQTRTHMAASLGSAVTAAGLAFIAAQIV